MRPNVKLFAQILTEEMTLPSPVVDIGSLRVEGQEDYADLRPFMGTSQYVGFDMRPGAGVDALGSIHELPLRASTAGTVFALDTLEHVLDPIAAARELCAAVRPGGVVALTSHMNFPIHAHPSDYWRFTPMVFDYLISPLATRYVLMQGNSENPHTVIAVGMKASGGVDDELAFRGAVERLRSRWPDDAFGGPLLLHEALEIGIMQRDAEITLPELSPGHRIEQTFVCDRDGLSRVDVKMSNTTQGTFRNVMFRLYEDGAKDPIASHQVLAWHVIDDAWLPVPVPRQDHSGGRTYRLTIESPTGEGLPVGVKGTGHAVESGLVLRVDGSPTTGAMAFQTYHAASRALHDDQASSPLPEGSRPAFQTAHPDVLSDQLGRMVEEQWQQIRYLAAELTASVDALREQIRSDHAAQMEIQQRTLEASLSKTIARTVRRTPLSRLLGDGKNDTTKQ